MYASSSVAQTSFASSAKAKPDSSMVRHRNRAVSFFMVVFLLWFNDVEVSVFRRNRYNCIHKPVQTSGIALLHHQCGHVVRVFCTMESRPRRLVFHVTSAFSIRICSCNCIIQQNRASFISCLTLCLFLFGVVQQPRWLFLPLLSRAFAILLQGMFAFRLVFWTSIWHFTLCRKRLKIDGKLMIWCHWCTVWCQLYIGCLTSQNYQITRNNTV